ncbi:MAG: flagellin [Deltaproteobacteria bacterium]|nr:flagellin [Deltaproteobacteria bacterium]
MSEGNFLTINKDGNEILKSPIDIFQTLADLQTALAAGDQTAIKAMMPTLESALEQVINHRSDIGSITVRLDAAEADNEELIEAYTKILSDTEDVDIAKATSDFAFQEQVYQATLMVSDRVMQLSLLDFIR